MMPWTLSAREAAARIRTGALTSVELVETCIERIAHTDSEIGAWSWLDPSLALTQAKLADDMRRAGQPLGALHGVPVGIKDIFDTKDMPTGFGTRVHADRRSDTDAALVEKLRSAGAVILGKTVTTPFAFASPARTRNPHDRSRSPGGSSSGSAAAVAAGHVPLALGTQTGGSTIRPASFCGIHAFKPTRGMFSRRGCLETSATLDQPGIFARSMDDLALLGDALSGHDAMDEASLHLPLPKLEAGYASSFTDDPKLAWFDLPYTDRLSPAMREGLADLLEELGDRVEHIAMPSCFTAIIEQHAIVHRYEFHRLLAGDPGLQPAEIDTTMADLLAHGARITDSEYDEAKAGIGKAEAFFETFFDSHDAIIAPAALGEAPLMAEGTGDSVCSVIWTFAGLPCVSLPWLEGQGRLPMGVQLIGPARRDDRLFGITAWLERRLGPADDEDDA